jgi:aldehyde dehydrogenase (NAD+)
VPDEAFPVPALDFYEILETSDMPDGVCNILSGSRQHLTKYLVEHQQLSAVWYINESNEAKINDEELLIQQFIKFTSNHSLKHTWIINNSMQIENGSVGRNYLKEVQKNSVQHKYIHIPMGVIFAN